LLDQNGFTRDDYSTGSSVGEKAEQRRDGHKRSDHWEQKPVAKRGCTRGSVPEIKAQWPQSELGSEISIGWESGPNIPGLRNNDLNGDLLHSSFASFESSGKRIGP
jgi:hypothetical protein